MRRAAAAKTPANRTPGPARREPYHHGDLRNALLQAALQLVQEKRSIHFSLRDLAERVGVTQLASYRHFTDFDELLSTLWRDGFDAVTVTSSLVDQPMSSVPGVLTSLTKGALNAATRALAIEHAKNGVRVTVVLAGTIKTPMHSPEIHPFFASLHPMGRIGEISEIVDAILYLDSANFITGENLHVDGGQSARHHAINP